MGLETLPIILSAITAFLATLSAGLLIKRVQSRVGIVCAFSAGFFIALATFELFPEALALLTKVDLPLVSMFLAALTGFGLLFILNLTFSRMHMNGHHAGKATQPKIGFFSTIQFCSHAFLEGIAIGVSFQIQFSIGFFVAAAVIAHDFCDGISTLALMLSSGNSLKSSLGMLIIDATAPVLGATTTLLFIIPDFVLGYTLAFLTGSFLFIGAGTLLPDAYKMNRPVTTITLFLVGFVVIAIFSMVTG